MKSMATKIRFLRQFGKVALASLEKQTTANNMHIILSA